MSEYLKAEMKPNGKQMTDGTMPLTMDVLDALADEQDLRQLGFTFFCHRKSIVEALRNELHRQANRGLEVAAPAPRETVAKVCTTTDHVFLNKNGVDHTPTSGTLCQCGDVRYFDGPR